jgi:hypothetical protein
MAVMAIARKQQDFKVAASIPTTPASYKISTIVCEVNKLTSLGIRGGIRGGISKLKSASFTYFISNMPFFVNKAPSRVNSRPITSYCKVVSRAKGC